MRGKRNKRFLLVLLSPNPRTDEQSVMKQKKGTWSCSLEWMVKFLMDAELLQQKTSINLNDIAEKFIKLERLSYDPIGCLAFESEKKLDTLDLLGCHGGASALWS